LKKLITWLGWAMTGMVVAAVSFVVAASYYGWEFDAVLSASMEPALGVGGLVVIQPNDAQDIKTGDVISFKLPGIDTPICHRVIDIQEADGNRLFQTKGDANEEPDLNLVSVEDVTGKQVFYLPYVGYLGYLTDFGRTPVALMGKRLPAAVLLILAMGLAFIGLTLKDTLEDIYRPSKRWRRETLKKRRERLLKQRKAFGIGL
jgi:signal peptidase